MDFRTYIAQSLASGFTKADDVFVNINSESAANTFLNSEGCSQRRRSKNPEEPGYTDFDFYKKKLLFLETLPAKLNIIDIGCGDGRITEYILNNTHHNILATDININDLKKIEADFAKHKDRFATLKIDANNIKNIGVKFDIIIAFEVLYILSRDIIKEVQQLIQICNNNGKLLISNPCFESYFIHALINNDNDSIQSLANNQSYHDLINKDPKAPFKIFPIAINERKRLKDFYNENYREDYVDGFGAISRHYKNKNDVELILNDQTKLNIPRIHYFEVDNKSNARPQ